MIPFPSDVTERAQKVLATCGARGITVITAESCTGGLIAAALTAVPGSSTVVEGGFVTYSNTCKETMLNVAPSRIRTFGAVSEEVAHAMALGALNHSSAGLSVAATGIAGPEGGTADKPVGLVHLAVGFGDGRQVTHRRHVFDGDRDAVRMATVAAALDLILEVAEG